jgi:hypothetical protein
MQKWVMKRAAYERESTTGSVARTMNHRVWHTDTNSYRFPEDLALQS